MFEKNNSPGRYCDIWDYFLQFNGQLYEFWSFSNSSLFFFVLFSSLFSGGGGGGLRISDYQKEILLTARLRGNCFKLRPGPGSRQG